MNRSLTWLLMMSLLLAPALVGCASRPTADERIKAERPKKPRRKPISGLTNPRFETEDAMIAASELLLTADPFWVRFGELGWLDDARLEHKDMLTETGPAYSRYNIDALLLTSGLGVPLEESPLAEANRARMSLLREAFGSYPLLNPDPIYLEYASGDPHYTQYPRFGNPTAGTVTDGATLRWNTEWFDRALHPATLGSCLTAEILWARRLLWVPPKLAEPEGDSLPKIPSLEEPADATEEGAEPSEDSEGYGEDEEAAEEFVDAIDALAESVEPAPEPPRVVSDEDRALGILLTEMAVHKVQALATRFTIDSASRLLGRVPNGYRPEETGQPFVYFPHTIVETKYLEPGPERSIDPLTVEDDSSHLWDQLMLVSGLLEFIDFNDHQAASEGSPLREFRESNARLYENASKQAKATINLVIRNILLMHHEPDARSLVSYSLPWEKGRVIETRDAAFALLVFERYLAQDWPADELKEQVKPIVEEQCRLLLSKQYYDGAFADSYRLDKKKAGAPRGFHLETQAYAIRGLLSGFRLTGDFQLRRAAWRTYQFLEENLWAPSHDLYRVEDLVAKGQKHNAITPLRLGATIGALRDLSLETRDFSVVERLTEFMRGVTRSGLLLSELQVTGENYGDEWDFDGDSILKPQFAAVPFGLAPVFASEVLVYIASTGDIIPLNTGK